MPKVPSSRSKKVFRSMLATFGIEPRIFNHYDEDESHQVDMVHAEDTPAPGGESTNRCQGRLAVPARRFRGRLPRVRRGLVEGCAELSVEPTFRLLVRPWRIGCSI